MRMWPLFKRYTWCCIIWPITLSLKGPVWGSFRNKLARRFTRTSRRFGSTIKSRTREEAAMGRTYLTQWFTSTVPTSKLIGHLFRKAFTCLHSFTITGFFIVIRAGKSSFLFIYAIFLFIDFLVADTRLYTLPCRSVDRSVGPSHFWILSGFCITAPAQPSATGLPCIRPCFGWFLLLLTS